MDMKWYVVYTKPGSEKKVSEILTRRKIENYSPINVISRNWSDKKEKSAPLFKGYVFVKASELQHPELKKINGVVNLVFWMGKPVSITNVEIKVIKLFLNEYTNVALEKTAIKHENKNAIDYRDTETELEVPMITIKNKKAYVGLPSLGYIMTAEVETPNVRIISTETSLNRATLKPGRLFSKVSEINNSLKNYWVKAFIFSICVLLLGK